jgi:hypothetical protein
MHASTPKSSFTCAPPGPLPTAPHSAQIEVVLDPYARAVLSRRRYGALGPKELDYTNPSVLGLAETWPQVGGEEGLRRAGVGRGGAAVAAARCTQPRLGSQQRRRRAAAGEAAGSSRGTLPLGAGSPQQPFADAATLPLAAPARRRTPSRLRRWPRGCRRRAATALTGRATGHWDFPWRT